MRVEWQKIIHDGNGGKMCTRTRVSKLNYALVFYVKYINTAIL